MARILIVDDEPNIVRTLQVALQSQGYEVLTANSPQEAEEVAVADRPDLMIIDVMMPEGSEGFQLVWQIRNDPKYKDLPILILTAIHEKTDLRFYPTEGDQTYGPGEYLPVQGFVDKPIQPTDLIAKVEELLKKGR